MSKFSAITLMLSLLILGSIISDCCGSANSATTVKDGIPCTIDESFSLNAEQEIFPFECTIGPEYNQLYGNYSYEGIGASAYILTVTQYDSYLENVKKDPKYVPQKYDCFKLFNTPDFEYKSTTGIFTYSMSNFGKLRMLVKQNPKYRGSKPSEFSIQLTMTPQFYNNNFQPLTEVIIGSLVGVLSFLACIGILVIIVFIIQKRKTAYSEIIEEQQP